MSEGASTKLDWDALAGKAAKYIGAFIGIMLGVISLPMLADHSPARLLVAAALGLAALAAFLSGRSLSRRGDATEGAARLLVGVLFLAGAAWFSNLFPSPTAIQAPTVAGHVNDAIRTVASAPPRRGMGEYLNWTIYEPEPSAKRLAVAVEGALDAEMAARAVGDEARQVAAGVRLTTRSGSLAGGQVTASMRVALASNGAPQCDFALSTPRAMPLKTAAEWLAEQAVDHAQTYVEGSDTC